MNMSTTLLCILSIGLLSWGSVCTAQDYEIRGGYPTPEAARRVQDDQDYQRAIQAYRFFYPTGVIAPFPNLTSLDVGTHKGLPLAVLHNETNQMLRAI